MAQFKGFRRDYQESRLQISVNGVFITQASYEMHVNRELPPDSVVKFIPVVEGSGLETSAIIAIVAIVFAVGAVGYSIYTSSQMKKKSASQQDDSTTITNNSFTSAENRVGQGRPVPLLMGHMRVGSNIISLGLDTSNDKNWTETVS